MWRMLNLVLLTPVVALDKPIVFQVMEKGKPYPKKGRISVNGSGSTRGKANPNYAKPDENGMISTKVTPGSAPGLYIITAETASRVVVRIVALVNCTRFVYTHHRGWRS